MSRGLALAAMGVLLTGCSALSVQVDVLQPAYLHSAALEERLSIEAHQLALGTEADRAVDAFIDQKKGKYLDFRDKCIEATLELVNAMPAGPRKSALLDQYGKVKDDPKLKAQIDQTFNRARDNLYEANRKVGHEIAANYPDVVGDLGVWKPLPAGLRAALLNRRQLFLDTQRKLFYPEAGQSAFCSGLALPQPVSPKAESAITAQANAQSTGGANDNILGGGQTLVSDLGAFDATKADKHAWAEKFNKSSGWGFGGNTDIAFKLNSTGDFTVKGFVFDGRSTAEMVSKVGIQAVSTIAQAYGLPVAAPPQTNGAATGPAVVSSTAAADNTTIAAAQADAAAYRAALFRIVDLVLANPDGIKGENSPEAAAVRAAIATDAAHWTVPAQH